MATLVAWLLVVMPARFAVTDGGRFRLPSIGDVFWARRALHEAVVHGWDAAAAAQAELDVPDDVVADGSNS
ncbi:hypothetical protein AB0L63_18900 [Nocardia sp. NPDC051990]|uniref:hypothetical protein n=1 Tax=Nocardia sp. NPDC051990 TaxID=3155285 RepID=UPI00343C6786